MSVPGGQGKGVFYCATCDGTRFADKVVAVVGGGDSGITEGLFLTRFVQKAIVIEELPRLSATRVLQERAFSSQKMEIRCGVRIEAIVHDKQDKVLELLDVQTRERSALQVDGILVHIGLEPNTNYLSGVMPLDEKGHILVNKKMETKIPGIFAAGDIRHNSPMQIVKAAGDGAPAALSLEKYLASL